LEKDLKNKTTAPTPPGLGKIGGANTPQKQNKSPEKTKNNMGATRPQTPRFGGNFGGIKKRHQSTNRTN
jgi:hypothetical protein